MTDLSASARRTYRYLRVSIIALLVLLAVSVVLQTAHQGHLLGSISAYFYTPLRSVFVGSLVGIGVALIAIKGRDGAENAMLNIAGMLTPVIAFVPTPVVPGPCGRALGCVTAAVLPAVRNNVWALLAVGAASLIAVGIGAARTPAPPPPVLIIASMLWIAAVVWFSVWQQSFVSLAHYVSAAGLFLLIVAVAVINAVKTPRHCHPPVASGRAYRWVYRIVAAVTLAAILVAFVLFVADRSGAVHISGWMLPVEAVLIGTFALFWLAQTVQFWDDGVPECG